MICYTRNFEDVILQRVFADVAKGHYLDVGASAPINDSNTYALYQKGWRGVAVEPLPYQALWQMARPEDVLLNLAVGEQAGHLLLQVYDQSQQISSGSVDVVNHWLRNGIQPTHSIKVPMQTLNQIIEDHLPGLTLHLLSIDVEGMEHPALLGLDLRAHRPWLIVMEAVRPGCPVAAHQEWEYLLLQADYLMAYFDGVNRFYLAHEQRSLLDRFALPPNVWDDFQMAKQLELQSEIARLKAQLAKAQPR